MSLTACLLPPWLPPQGKLSRVSRSGVVLETISLDEGFITWSLISGPAPQQQRQQQQQQGQGQQQQGHEVECLAQRMVCGVAAGDSVKQLAGRLQLTKDRAADLLLSFTNCFQGAPPSLHRGCAPSPSLLSTLKP